MPFEYIKLGKKGISRPLIPVTLINGDKRMKTLALIDSGADLCVFDIRIAEYLNIDLVELKNRRKTMFFPSTELEGSLSIKICNMKFNTTAIFLKYDNSTKVLPFSIIGRDPLFGLCSKIDFVKDEIIAIFPYNGSL